MEKNIGEFLAEYLLGRSLNESISNSMKEEILKLMDRDDLDDDDIMPIFRKLSGKNNQDEESVNNELVREFLTKFVGLYKQQCGYLLSMKEPRACILEYAKHNTGKENSYGTGSKNEYGPSFDEFKSKHSFIDLFKSKESKPFLDEDSIETIMKFKPSGGTGAVGDGEFLLNGFLEGGLGLNAKLGSGDVNLAGGIGIEVKGDNAHPIGDHAPQPVDELGSLLCSEFGLGNGIDMDSIKEWLKTETKDSNAMFLKRQKGIDGKMIHVEADQIDLMLSLFKPKNAKQHHLGSLMNVITRMYIEYYLNGTINTNTRDEIVDSYFNNGKDIKGIDIANDIVKEIMITKIFKCICYQYANSNNKGVCKVVYESNVKYIRTDLERYFINDVLNVEDEGNAPLLDLLGCTQVLYYVKEMLPKTKYLCMLTTKGSVSNWKYSLFDVSGIEKIDDVRNKIPNLRFKNSTQRGGNSSQQSTVKFELSKYE